MASSPICRDQQSIEPGVAQIVAHQLRAMTSSGSAWSHLPSYSTDGCLDDYLDHEDHHQQPELTSLQVTYTAAAGPSSTSTTVISGPPTQQPSRSTPTSAAVGHHHPPHPHSAIPSASFPANPPRSALAAPRHSPPHRPSSPRPSSPSSVVSHPRPPSRSSTWRFPTTEPIRHPHHSSHHHHHHHSSSISPPPPLPTPTAAAVRRFFDTDLPDPMLHPTQPDQPTLSLPFSTIVASSSLEPCPVPKMPPLRPEFNEPTYSKLAINTVSASDDGDLLLLSSHPESGSPLIVTSPTTCGPNQPPSLPSNSISDPSLSLPITPEALLKHVRQMRIVSKNRKPLPSGHPSRDLSSNLSAHSRAGSNASSNCDDGLSQSLYSSQLSYNTNVSATSVDSQQAPGSTQTPVNSQHTLPIPEIRQDDNRNLVETLDLSHQRIADLTQPVVEELAEYVERLALGYNYLPVLPDHFSLLGESLRYLNLRGNHMEIFPEVLTRMPSLEILDVSRNKIKAFPRRPGTLDRLRVLSVSRNRIRRLPNYVANLTTLRVLKIDHNPIVWPPRELITLNDGIEKIEEDELEHHSRVREETPVKSRTRTPSNETSTSMAQWLRTLQEWMRKNPYVRPIKQIRPSTGETIADPGEVPPLRHLDLDRRISTSKAAHSPDESPLFPPESAQSSLPINVSDQRDRDAEHLVQHNRNASSSSGSHWVRKRPELRLKKSLPDLRRNHAEIMVERRADADRSYSGLHRANHGLPPHSGTSVTFLLSSPSAPDRIPRSAQTLPSVPQASSAGSSTLQRTPLPPGVRFSAADVVAHEKSHARRIKMTDSGGDDRLAGDRNSGAYFRRLSMLPASTISKAVPIPLLQLMDAVRGILFSLSQIYAALKQFVVFATQDRLPGALSRVMSAADESMGRLINSLDRFDSSTRRTQPDSKVVLEVFRSCRDTVVIFGKLVNVLTIQLKGLTESADIRYSRTLLLSLYGAAAEIAMSWATITPLVDDVISLPGLRSSQSPEAGSSSDMKSSPELRETSSEYLSEYDSASEMVCTGSDAFEATASLANQRPSILSSVPISGVSNIRKGRRHAGSFSVEDVQLGAILPPASAGLLNNFPPSPIVSMTPAAPFPSMNAESPAAQRSGPEPSMTIPLSDSKISSGRQPSSSRTNGCRPNPPPLPLLTIGQRGTFENESSLGGMFSSSPSTATPRSNPPLPIISPCTPFFHGITSSCDSGVPSPDTSTERTHLTQDGRTHPTSRQLSTSTIATSARYSPDSAGRVRQHARVDSSLARTDQDFLDMAEATIAVAVSVTSMMLENLEQTSLDSRVNHEDSGATSTPGDHPGLESRRDRRPSDSGPFPKPSRAAKLKELCEIEIEIIKRLRGSLAVFWASRAARSSSDGASVSSDERDDTIKGPEAVKVSEDATAFVRAVIQTANLARATMNDYPLTKGIREGLGQLTKATKELATLLAVSSFKPGASQIYWGGSSPNPGVSPSLIMESVSDITQS